VCGVGGKCRSVGGENRMENPGMLTYIFNRCECNHT